MPLQCPRDYPDLRAMLGLYQQDDANSYSIVHSIDVITNTNQQDIEADNVQPRRQPDFLDWQCGDVHFEESVEHSMIKLCLKLPQNFYFEKITGGRDTPLACIAGVSL